MIVIDQKSTQAEIDSQIRPMELDLTAYFKTLQDVILAEMSKDQTPDQYLQSISRLLGGETTGIPLAKDDRPLNFVQFQGINIGIENPAGSVRTGVDPDGNEWTQEMHFDYGFIKNINAIDGDSLDVYIGPDKESRRVFIVRQQDPHTGAFDEYKVMLGFENRIKAVAGYLRQYDKPQFYGGMSEENIDKFKSNISVTKAQKFDIGDRKTRPDGTVWEKTGTYSWKKVDGGATVTPEKKPTAKPSKDDDTSDPKYMSADSASEIIDKSGKKGFWNLTKSGLNNWLKANGVDPTNMKHADKKMELERIYDEKKAKDKEEGTIKPKAFKPFSNENLSSPLDDNPDLIKAMYDKAEPKKGSHWGSASTHNTVAKGVAFTSGTNWRPINQMKDGKLADYNQMLGLERDDANVIAKGMQLRKYAQNRMKDHDRTEVPAFHRGMTLDNKQWDSVVSGESDTIEFTGCTAFSSYEDIAKRYSKSSWTKGFGADRKSIRVILERDDAVDDSIGMWHESHRSSPDNPKPAFELLTGLEAIRVIDVTGAKVIQPKTYENRAKKVTDSIQSDIESDLKREIQSEERRKESIDGYSWYSDQQKAQGKKNAQETIDKNQKLLDNIEPLKKKIGNITSKHYKHLSKVVDTSDETKTAITREDINPNTSMKHFIQSQVKELEEAKQHRGGTWRYDWLKNYADIPDEMIDMTVAEHKRMLRQFDLYNNRVPSSNRIKNLFKAGGGDVVLHCVAGRGKKAIQGSNEGMEDEK